MKETDYESLGEVLIEDGQRECRNCHSEGGDDLIAPCLCKGSIKWVHRTCLDEWRAVSRNPRSFSHCDVCGFEYRTEFVSQDCDCSKLKYGLVVTRDALIFLAVINGIQLLLSLFLWGVDRDHTLDHFFSDRLNINMPHFVAAYIFGWPLFFFVVGLFGISMGIAHSCGLCTPATHSTYNYGYGSHYCFFCFWPSCNCPGGGGNCSGRDCNCSGSKDCKEGLGVVLLVIVVVVIVIGLIIAIAFTVYIFYVIITRHFHILHQRHLAGQWVVKDLSNEEL